MKTTAKQAPKRAVWLARLAVGAVFLANLSAALPYLIWPRPYAAGFELEGVPGDVIVRGLGVLFLMWNATYPPVIVSPDRQRTLFAVILVQQLLGILGQLWIGAALPAGHAALRATGARFLAFDVTGLAAMGIAFGVLARRSH
jgi:hypothetical protein